MIKATVIDKDYGSVSAEKLTWLQNEYASRGIELRLLHLTQESDIIEQCQHEDVILATGNPPLTMHVLNNLPALRFVQRFGIGVNSIDLDAAAANGIVISNMPGFCITELAVHATAMILNIIRNIGFYDRGIRSGNWHKAKGPVPRNPQNLVLGLYGFGGSAREIYKIFNKGFGSRVIVNDPYFNNDGTWDVAQVNFEEMLQQADIISIHAPLTPETHHIFNAEAFRKMKTGAIIINIARGELINQDDLISAIETGEIFGAGLDVFAKEPLPADNRLTALETTVLTPHSAFYGEDAINTQLSLALSLVNTFINSARFDRRYISNKAVIEKLSHITLEN